MRNFKYFILFIMFSCSNVKHEILDINSPTSTKSEESSFFKTQEGIPGISWLEKSDSAIALKYSWYINDHWSEPNLIVKGNDMVANWADFPGVVTNGEHWISWYLKFSNPDIFAYDVMIVQSSDNGKTWSAPEKLHNDTIQAEHGFVSAVPTEGGFQLVWLDGRNSGGGHGGSGAMNLRTAFVDNSGNISDRKLLDDRTCDCCQTALISYGGDFVSVYRDRSEDEIRDMSFVRYNRDEMIKSQKVFKDNWLIQGCPVNGPRVLAIGDELIVVWFTMGEDETERIKVAFSSDGNSFSEPILVDTENYGRIDLLERNGKVYVSYIDKEEKGAVIKIAEIKDKSITSSYSIAHVSASRKTGFPRMMNTTDGIMISYTNADKGSLEVKKLLID